MRSGSKLSNHSVLLCRSDHEVVCHQVPNNGSWLLGRQNHPILCTNMSMESRNLRNLEGCLDTAMCNDMSSQSNNFFRQRNKRMCRHMSILPDSPHLNLCRFNDSSLRYDMPSKLLRPDINIKMCFELLDDNKCSVLLCRECHLY